MSKRINIYLTDEQLNFIKQHGEITMTEIIHSALNSYIKEHSLKVSTSPSYDKRRA